MSSYHARHDWTPQEIEKILGLGFSDLVHKASEGTRANFDVEVMPGANSIFLGDRLLTTSKSGQDRDSELMGELGIRLQT